MTLDNVARSVTSEINPSAGRHLQLKYSLELNKFFKDFATNNDYNTPQEVYSDYNYHRIEFNWHEISRHAWLPNMR